MGKMCRFWGVIAFWMWGMTPLAAQAGGPVHIGLDADMSSGSAQSGEAIRRGIQLAIDEINGAGGVLGRQLKLVVRDHRGNPARGRDNLTDFADMPDMLAVFSGIHTPVVLSELKLIHEKKLLFLVPWAAGTPIIDNGFTPNYVFRVSVRDQYAGEFLVERALDRGLKRLGLLFEQTGWGRSNERAVAAALAIRGLEYTAIEWFSWGTNDLTAQIERLREAGAEAVLLVANPREGSAAVRSMAGQPVSDRLPIISHWGISGGNFYSVNSEALAQVDFQFLQTFSFLAPPVPARADHLWQLYDATFPDVDRREEVFSPVGTAHAYDLMQLLVLAVLQAGGFDRAAVRDAMESLPNHKGIMKTYEPAFTSGSHDALTADSFIMARFGSDGEIRPASKP